MSGALYHVTLSADYCIYISAILSINHPASQRIAYYLGVARAHIITQSMWWSFWNDMPDKFKKSFEKKLEKTAAGVLKYSKNSKP